DVRTLWIDPENSNRILLGSDGGLHISYDGGKTCDHHDNLPLGEFYAIGVDMEDPYNIYGGLQDHDTWKGPSNGWSGRITLADWVTVGSGDGMYVQVDPEDSRWVYTDSQFGGHYRVDQKRGTRTRIQPVRPEGEPPYRFNWCPPIHISPHNSRIIYTGAQVLLRSLNRGDDWQEISPDLTTNDPVKIAGRGHIQYCTITTISESPLVPGVIWVGTDDGRVWLTKNSGATWEEMTKKIEAQGGPAHLWVSRVFASSHDPGAAYVTKTGYRRDDFRPFIFKTTDFGNTWTSMASNLPNAPINVVFEDRKNPDLLFVGTDIGVFVSINGGKSWVRFKNNMPSVPVSDLLVHPRENDLVVGTYGRGLFVTDVSVLQELSEEMLEEDLHLFRVEPRVQRIPRAWGNYHLYGDRHLSTPNEPQTVAVVFYLKKNPEEDVVLAVSDLEGRMLHKIQVKAKKGINRIDWDMRSRPSGEEARRRGQGRGALVPPGQYRVTLRMGSRTLSQKIWIRTRKGWQIGPRTSVIG
ncbi:MAG: WD40/YVTN/BNR-like repeat-containing protein, partial [Candidatus Aminicenantales bacterium]